MTDSDKKNYLFLLGGGTLFGLYVLYIYGPIPQCQSYMEFADKDKMLGIENAFDVISNFPFLLVGLLGLKKISQSETLKIEHENLISYQLFFLALVLMTFGSVYFHLSPSNDTLFWDRLPMGVSFMALVSIVIGEFFSASKGRASLIPLQLISIMSVSYWLYTESIEASDLRFWVFIQFYPMILIIFLLMKFPLKYTHKIGYWWVLGLYALAKVFELYDKEVFDLLSHKVSGHTLKHLIAGIGVYILLITFEKRRAIPTN